MAGVPCEALSTAIIRRPGEAEARGGACDGCRGGCRRIFPLSLPCCPCLPTSWTKVQDWLHLVLILGVLASLACVVQMVYEFAVGDDWKQVFSGICVLPSTLYFIKTIGSYDEQLREKKERHREEVENLIEVINGQVAEMNDLCRKVTENANEFAVGRFNDKCESFQRFLRGIAAHYRDLYVSEDILKELRSFVVTWMRVFAGSLLNPQSSPMLRGAEEELIRCHSADKICEVALRRIKDSRVAFQFQMPAEAPMMTGRFQQSFASSAAERSADEAGGARSLCCPDGRCGVTWLRFGKCQGCGYEWSASADGMPLALRWGCCRVRVLSRPHANLLFAFFLDILLIVFEVCSWRWASMVLVAVNEICLVSMLACFEQINEIAQLERQIHAYEQRSEEVGRRRDEARNNWEKVQQLHDLWLYRTLPSLAIMGKIQNHLTDEDMVRQRDLAAGMAGQDQRPGFLRLANESLDCLERKLGPLEDWSGPERLDERWKQSIGQQLKACEGSTDLTDLLARLPIITSDLSMLEAPPPSASEDLIRGSRAASPRTSPPGSPRSCASSSVAAAAATEPSAAAGAPGGRSSWRRPRG